ncbi:MAG: hypothetical protein V4599_00020, partial [Verrucomicrobiota bacterium]
MVRIHWGAPKLNKLGAPVFYPESSLKIFGVSETLIHGEFKTCIILDEDQAEAVSELRMEINPYAPPQTELDASAGMPEVDKIRRSHLAIEGGIQSMGS